MEQNIRLENIFLAIFLTVLYLTFLFLYINNLSDTTFKKVNFEEKNYSKLTILWLKSGELIAIMLISSLYFIIIYTLYIENKENYKNVKI